MTVMALKLSPELIAAAYEFLRVTAPFRSWRLPPAGEVEFVVSRHRFAVGYHRGARRKTRSHEIGISEVCVGHTNTLLRTMAHEMIHQWQFDVLCRRPNHGAEFCRVMARMNLDGLGITIRHSLDRAVQALTKYTWRCTECGCEYHRQRKTIRPRRHRCGACLGKLRELPRVVEESYVVSTGSAMSSSESPPARAVTDQAASCLQLVLPYVGS